MAVLRMHANVYVIGLLRRKKTMRVWLISKGNRHGDD